MVVQKCPLTLVVDLFCLQPMGVFMVLEEECMFPKATDKTYLEKLIKNNAGKQANFGTPSVGSKKKCQGDYHFEIHHYAGTVSSWS